MTANATSSRRWRHILPLALAGALGGLVAFAAAFATYGVLYTASMQQGDAVDNWLLSYWVFFALLVGSMPLSGAAGGLLGALPGGLLMRQRRIKRGVLIGWALAWICIGAGLWSVIAMAGMSNPGDQSGTWWIWLLVGAGLGGSFGAMLSPLDAEV
ncbi:MAG: hypothetical protein OHK0022_54070 [Roseiflexaceae bacterium]